MVAIGPRGTAYTAAAFEIFADLYYRTSASVSGATGHQALRTLLDGDTRVDLRAELAQRVIASLDIGLAPARSIAALPDQQLGKRVRGAGSDTTGPAGFALEAVWARLSETPGDPGVLGAAYLAADFTAQLTRRLKAEWPAAEQEYLQTVAALGNESGGIATTLRHKVLEALSDDPALATAIFLGFDRLAVIYPTALLDYAVLGAMDSRAVA